MIDNIEPPKNADGMRRRRRRTSSEGDINSVIDNIQVTDGKRRRRRSSPTIPSTSSNIDVLPSVNEHPKQKQEIDQVIPEEVETEVPIPTSDEGINDINKIRREFIEEAYSPLADPSYSDALHDWATENEDASADYWHFLSRYE